MKKISFLIFVFLCIYEQKLDVHAETIQVTLAREAQEAYKNSEFNRALEIYQKIIAGKHLIGEIYYNIGNCYFKLHEIGRAILYYEKAKALLKNDRELEENMKYARNFLKDKTVELPKGLLYNILYLPNQFVNFNLMIILITIMIWTEILIISFILMINKNMPVLRLTSLILFFVILFFLASCGLTYYQEKIIKHGIVVNKETEVRSGPEETFQKKFIIHEGMKITLLDIKEEWSEIGLENGLAGWIRNNSYEQI